MDKLQSRGIQVDTTCRVCNCGIETICHLLFTFPMAKDTWERSANSVFLNIYHLLEKSKKFPKNLNVNSFPWILWHLWKAQNGLTFERIQYSSVSVVTRAKEEANVWFEVNFPGAEVSQIPHTIRDNFVSWSKHPTGFLKCNVGISWVSRHVNCGVAWILRDNKGKAILHSRHAFSNVESQRDAELIGLQWGVKYMVNTHQRNIIFDSSCALARDTFLNMANYMEHVLITNDIKYMLCSLQDWSFHHSDQRKNTIAQDIAESVTSERRYQFYIAFGAPSWLSRRVESDAGAWMARRPSMCFYAFSICVY